MDLTHISSEKVAERLHTDVKKGLTTQEANRRLLKAGANEIIAQKKKGVILRFFEQFKDFMILILLTAAVVSFITAMVDGNGEYVDAIIILVIVVCNAVIGTVQEIRADKAIEALKKMSSPHATVMRDGKKKTIESTQVVPGDIVYLKTGDLVPADIRLVYSTELKTEESALTGESVPVEKDAGFLLKERTIELSEQKNMVFAATGIAAGSAYGIVVASGMNTEMGRIAQMLDTEEAPQTPLQEKLKQLGKALGIGVIIICAIIFLLGVLHKTAPFEMFMISISLAVAAIPEGMPAVVTIVLAMGIKTMAKKRAIVRHMPAVETLGSTQVICSDKTGTLTQNRMTITTFVSAIEQHELNSAQAQSAIELCVLCNNSEMIGGKVTGDPTETAFLRACNTEKAVLERSCPRVGEIPFSSARKMMTTAHRRSGGFRIITKGAPDVLLSKCTHYIKNGAIAALTPAVKSQILKANERMASGALRVLAVGSKDVSVIPSSDADIESGLVFCGLLGMEDPPRKGVKQAVGICKRAGILPVMITGDHEATALAIGARLGFLDRSKKVMTGKELDRISDEELANRIFDYRIFARVSPKHKVKIVKAFQSYNMVVAMTGDGVNDAPALKKADIGCAMGKSGTEVAKSAADMILTDDDFTTIVSAVKEGRGIYKNIRKTIHFLLSSNIGEILLIFVAFLMRIPTPLVAIQLLWVNLVTDSLPALALGSDPVDPHIMEETPHKKNEGIFSGGMGLSIIIEGCFIGALALLAYTIGRTQFDMNPADPIIGRTMAFAVLCFSQLIHSFNVRSDRSVFSIGLLSNRYLNLAFLVCALLMVLVITVPFLSAVFKTTLLSLYQWAIVVLLSLSPLLIVELEKRLKRSSRKKKRLKQTKFIKT